ncbi:hypothetical protein ACK8HX_08945, partial [Oryzobacter sp. R7]
VLPRCGHDSSLPEEVRTLHQTRGGSVTWTERTYHRRRRQRALGKLTPIEFETINRAAHAA